MAEKYHKDGFYILAFPCNQLNRQEPGDEAEIKAFVQKHYGIPSGFQLFSKVEVNGKDAHPGTFSCEQV